MANILFENNSLPNDKSRFIAVLSLLPEKFVDDLVNFHLFNAHYPSNFTDIFLKYDDYRSEIMSEFSNYETNTAWNKLNEAYLTLSKFLITHFSVPNVHKQQKNPWFYLETKIHHNFRISEGDVNTDDQQDSREWNKYKRDLDKLAGDFEKSYKDLIETAKKHIVHSVNTESTNKESLEKTDYKIAIVIHRKNGIYRDDNPDKIYEARGKRLDLVWALKDGVKTGNHLAKLYYKKSIVNLSKAITGEKSTKGINFHVRNKLDANSHNLIKNQRGGYCINAIDFDIKWKE